MGNYKSFGDTKIVPGISSVSEIYYYNTNVLICNFFVPTLSNFLFMHSEKFVI